MLCDVHEDKLAEVAKTLPRDRTLALRCDVTRFDDVQKLVAAAVERFGALDVMCNNAGIASEGNVLEVPFDEWKKTVDTDLGGVFHGCRAALPELLKTGGCIVNTASVSGLGADWAMSAYNTAKGGVVNLTRAIALDFGSQGRARQRGLPVAHAHGHDRGHDQGRGAGRKFMERMPLGRVAEPADIAGVVAFLASDDARFVNGVNLPVDGGVMASNGQPPQA